MLIALESIVARILYGTGDLRIYTRLTIAQAALNLGLSVILIQYIGIRGVAWGSTAAFTCYCIYIIAYISFEYGLRFPGFILRSALGPVLAAFVMALAWLFIIRNANIDSWSMLLVASGFLTH